MSGSPSPGDGSRGAACHRQSIGTDEAFKPVQLATKLGLDSGLVEIDTMYAIQATPGVVQQFREAVGTLRPTPDMSRVGMPHEVAHGDRKCVSPLLYMTMPKRHRMHPPQGGITEVESHPSWCVGSRPARPSRAKSQSVPKSGGSGMPAEGIAR